MSRVFFGRSWHRTDIARSLCTDHKFSSDRPATPVDHRVSSSSAVEALGLLGRSIALSLTSSPIPLLVPRPLAYRSLICLAQQQSEDAMRREEEELQRALAESAQMADPRRGFVASQPPSASTSGSKALPQHPPSNPHGYESSFRPPSRSSAISDPRAQGRERRVRAIYDFEGGQGPDELPFIKGDVIKVLETVYADWWRGELRGREGIFPANRVVSHHFFCCARKAAS